jgi:hypothetical protein
MRMLLFTDMPPAGRTPRGKGLVRRLRFLRGGVPWGSASASLVALSTTREAETSGKRSACSSMGLGHISRYRGGGRRDRRGRADVEFQDSGGW